MKNFKEQNQQNLKDMQIEIERKTLEIGLLT